MNSGPATYCVMCDIESRKYLNIEALNREQAEELAEKFWKKYLDFGVGEVHAKAQVCGCKNE